MHQRFDIVVHLPHMATQEPCSEHEKILQKSKITVIYTSPCMHVLTQNSPNSCCCNTQSNA